MLRIMLVLGGGEIEVPETLDCTDGVLKDVNARN
jgi:hypothetical protein